jgi:hypothetical protein
MAETSAMEGFNRFVTSTVAPLASGWSRRRVGLTHWEIAAFFTAQARDGHQRPGHDCPDTGHSALRHVVSDCLHDTGRKIEPLLHQISSR